MEVLRAKYASIISDSLAGSSKIQYERCWKLFNEFCQQHELDPLGERKISQKAKKKELSSVQSICLVTFIHKS